MKKSITIICAIALLGLFSINVNAQVKTPAPSPFQKMTQTVGLTDITVEFSRPGVKGRDIFSVDGLVPFGKKWRTGANKCTTLRFGDDVKVGGVDIKKGDYALYTIPGEKEWTIILYSETSNWGLPKEWDKTKEVANFKVETRELPFGVETLDINIGNIKSESASMYLLWDKTMISIPIEVEINSKVMKAFDKLLAGPSGGDYYKMASYNHETVKDLDKALEYVNKAIDMQGKFWQYRRKALILGDMGRKNNAISAAKESLRLAKEAGNMDYVRSNEKSIAEWMK